MSPHPGTRLLAVTLAATGVLAVPSAAHAERVVTEDAVSDVVSVDFGEGDDLDEAEVTPAPDVTTVDITRTVVDHGPARLRVVLRHRDLLPVRFRLTALEIRTPHGRYEVFATSAAGLGRMTEFGRKGPGRADCDGVRTTVDRAKDRTTITVPTSCLGDPRWVQVGAGSGTVPGGPEVAETAEVLVDDGNLAGVIREDSLALGPRVYRD